MSTVEHFDMGRDYAEHSSSQKTIGAVVIEKAVDKLQAVLDRSGDNTTINVLDVACGPGNLTRDLRDSLGQKFPGRNIDVTGLDYSDTNVERLVQGSRGEIRGVVGSFFDTDLLPPKGENLIFSNEGLHWQPPYEMDEIIYTHLSGEEKERYIAWAMRNFETAIQNIYNSLANNGVAVLQFGHEGQLENLWKLISDVLADMPEYARYKSSINFPLFYPSLQQIQDVLKTVGFKKGDIEIDSFSQDLTEDTADEITAFLRAFSEPALRQVMGDGVESFYAQIKQRLENMDLDTFRGNAWHRTLIVAQKKHINQTYSAEVFEPLAKLLMVTPEDITSINEAVRLIDEKKAEMEKIRSAASEELLRISSNGQSDPHIWSKIAIVDNIERLIKAVERLKTHLLKDQDKPEVSYDENPNEDPEDQHLYERLDRIIRKTSDEIHRIILDAEEISSLIANIKWNLTAKKEDREES